MKLFNDWPSKFTWTFWLGGNLAYKDKWKNDAHYVNNRIMEATGASQINVSFPNPDETSLDVDMELSIDSLRNDEKIFRIFPILKEFGLFSFEAELMAVSDNGMWDAYVAYYEYNPARWTGIERTYISCAECKSLCHRLNPEEIYTTFDALLWLRSDDKVCEEGGTVHVDFQSRLVVDKRPVLAPPEEKEENYGGM